MELSTQQQQALQAVQQWLENPGDRQCFRLFGYAGTGKTTIAQQFAQSVQGKVLFASYTGKAALVMQRKGCIGAQTIHRLLYVPTSGDRDQIDELMRELEALEGQDPKDQEAIDLLKLEIAEEKAKLRQPRFSVNPDSEFGDAKLIVIDEVSMVGKRVAEDMLSFGRPILVLGDPAQLPPVGEGGYFTKQKPDFLLTEIHRQSIDSPVLMLATRVRNSEALPYGEWGESRVIPKGVLNLGDVAQFDQVICGTNKARQDLNRQIRQHLGRKTGLPEPGDKLVCLRNNYESGFLNGSLWTVTDSKVVDDERIWVALKDEDSREIDCVMWQHHFFGREDEILPWDIKNNECFDFGYALTCHKSQGSQWNNVLVIDESYIFRGDSKRWLYTAITRAANSVTVVKK